VTRVCRAEDASSRAVRSAARSEAKSPNTVEPLPVIAAWEAPRARQRAHDARNVGVAARDRRLQIVDQICTRVRPRASGRTVGVEPCVRLARTDAEIGQDEHDRGRRAIDQREEQVAALEAEHRAALEEVRDVGAERAADRARPRLVHAPQPRQRADRRRGVAAAAAEARVDRNPLLQIDRDAARRAPASRRSPHALGGAPDQVRATRRAIRIVAGQAETRRAFDGSSACRAARFDWKIVRSS